MRYFILLAALWTTLWAGELQAKPVLQSLPPWLGVTIVDGAQSATISEVIPDSPAAIEGLMVGDNIVEVDGKAITSSQLLIQTLQRYKVGDSVLVRIRRRRRVRSVTIRLSAKLSLDELFERRLLGKRVPDFVVEAVDKKSFRLQGSSSEKVRILFFWDASGSKPKVAQTQREALEELAGFQTLHMADMQVVVVSSNQIAELVKLSESMSAPIAVTYDARLSARRSFRHVGGGGALVVVAQDGTVIHAAAGANMELEDGLLAARRAMRQ